MKFPLDKSRPVCAEGIKPRFQPIAKNPVLRERMEVAVKMVRDDGVTLRQASTLCGVPYSNLYTRCYTFGIWLSWTSFENKSTSTGRLFLSVLTETHFRKKSGNSFPKWWNSFPKVSKLIRKIQCRIQMWSVVPPTRIRRGNTNFHSGHLLTEDEEKQLVCYIIEKTQKGAPFNPDALRNLAHRILKDRKEVR